MTTISANLAFTIGLVTGITMYLIGIYVGRNWNNYIKE